VLDDLRPDAHARQRLAEPEAPKHTGCVGRHLDAGPDFAKRRRLFVDGDVDAGPAQGERGGEPTDPGADDDSSERHGSGQGGHDLVREHA